MSNVVQFPTRAHIGIGEFTNQETGKQVFLMVYVDGATRTIVGEYDSQLDLVEALVAWREDGFRIERMPTTGGRGL